MLLVEQQEQLLQLLLRGASPAGACQAVGISIFSLHRTLTDSHEFRKRVEQVRNALSDNVAAALYRAAMEGNVSAQSFWLKTFPPSAWSTMPHGDPESGQYDDLSDHELVDLARAMGIDIPPEIEGKARSPGG